MREIKFRAWDKENNYMLYSSHDNILEGGQGQHEDQLHIWLNGTIEICNGERNYFPNGIGYENDTPKRFILQQFAGLKDKNGKEIYEGDILKYYSYCNLGHTQKFSIKAVEWGQTGDSDGYSHCKHYEWTVGGDSLADIADSNYREESYCEIIGNIYENPELVEVKQC